MRTSRVVFSLAAVAAMTSASRQGAAQQPSFDARTWRPSFDPQAGLVVEPTTTQGAGAFSVGTYLNYTLYPVTLRSPGSADVKLRPVEQHVGMDLVAGVGLGSRLAIGVAVPVALYQTGSENLPAKVATTPVAASAIGDLSLIGKLSVVDNGNGGFGLASIAALSLPTGDTSSFIGEGAATVSVRALAEWSLAVAGFQISAGYKLRTAERTWPDATAGGVTFGSELPWSAGLWLKPDVLHLDSHNRQRWEIAVHGSLPAGPVGPLGAGDPGSAQLSPVLVTLGDRVGVGRFGDAYVTAGLETSLGTAVGAPALRLVAGAGWAPREHDKDHDGIPDDVDQCEDIAEDKDGFEDSDGCPELDNDDDGIIDRQDACALVPGKRSADPAKNGCPVPDQDGDGEADDVDACPSLKGERNADPKRNGCPALDTDADGLPDYADKCPARAEDKDGFEDDDGCPDEDDDRDGVADSVDACPRVAGEPSADRAINGCPNPDRDGDTYLNDADQCPDSAEVWNGIKDDDGCPDEGGKPLVTIDEKNGTVKLTQAIKLSSTSDGGVALDGSSSFVARALASELNRHRDWTLAVGAKASSAKRDDGLERALAVVNAITQSTHHDGAAETVAWDAVKRQPGAETGIAMLLLVAPHPGAPPAPLPPATPAVTPVVTPAVTPAAKPPATPAAPAKKSPAAKPVDGKKK